MIFQNETLEMVVELIKADKVSTLRTIRKSLTQWVPIELLNEENRKAAELIDSYLAVVG